VKKQAALAARQHVPRRLRAVRKPEKQAISQTLRNTRDVVSRSGKFTFAPMLKMQTQAARRRRRPSGRRRSDPRRARRGRGDDSPARGLDLGLQRLELLAVAAPA